MAIKCSPKVHSIDQNSKLNQTTLLKFLAWQHWALLCNVAFFLLFFLSQEKQWASFIDERIFHTSICTRNVFTIQNSFHKRKKFLFCIQCVCKFWTPLNFDSRSYQSHGFQDTWILLSLPRLFSRYSSPKLFIAVLWSLCQKHILTRSGTKLFGPEGLHTFLEPLEEVTPFFFFFVSSRQKLRTGRSPYSERCFEGLFLGSTS